MSLPISRRQGYCTGSISEPNGSYITAVNIAVAKVKRQYEHHGSKTLDYICAFDKAEANEAYLGQTNIIYVSSFCSPDSFLWGYHLAKPSKGYHAHPLLHETKKINGAAILSAEPLTAAFRELVGDKQSRKFPFYPGTLLPAAGKSIESVGPAHIYAAIGIGVTDDPKCAHTFMEDIGEIPLLVEGKAVEEYKRKILTDIASSVLTVGMEQGINYSKIFVEIKSIEVSESEVGSSLVMAPYFNLAPEAAPDGFDVLKRMTLEDWKSKIKP